MPIGPILMLLLIIAVAFGLIPTALGRLGISHLQAMAGLMSMLLCSLVELVLAPGLVINLGTGLLPLLVIPFAVWTVPQQGSVLRLASAVIVTAAAVFLVGLFFPPGVPTELNLFGLDAQYLYAVTAGAAACATSRSGSGGFSAAIIGVLLADLAHFGWSTYEGIGKSAIVQIGGGSFYATPLVAGVLALWLAGIMGENAWNMTRMNGPVLQRGLGSGDQHGQG